MNCGANEKMRIRRVACGKAKTFNIQPFNVQRERTGYAGVLMTARAHPACTHHPLPKLNILYQLSIGVL